MSDSSTTDIFKPKIEIQRMKDIAIQLIDIIVLLSKKHKINTMTVLKHYTNITSVELKELDVKIVSDSITKK